MKRIPIILLCLAPLACSGRGYSGPPLATAKGTLTQNGAPVASANLQLFPVGNTKAPGSFGVTDENGNFELRTGNDGIGVPPGDYKVTVSKLVQADGSPIPPDAQSIAELQLKELLPTEYQSVEQTPVQISIPPGGTETLQISIP